LLIGHDEYDVGLLLFGSLCVQVGGRGDGEGDEGEEGWFHGDLAFGLFIFNSPQITQITQIIKVIIKKSV